MASPNEESTPVHPRQGLAPGGPSCTGRAGGGAWAPETAGASSLALHPGRLTMAEAASYTTISCLLRRQLSMKSNRGLSRLQRQAARGCWGAAWGLGEGSGGCAAGAVPLPAVLVLQLPAGHANHHAVGEGGFEAMPRELADHLADRQAVVLPHVVQEPQRVVLGGCRAARVRPEATGPAPHLWGGHRAQVWATPTEPPGTLQASVPRPRQAPRRRRNWRPGVSAQKEEAEPAWAEDISGAVQTGALTAGPRPPSPAPGCVAAAAKPAGGGEAQTIPSALRNPY